MILIQKAVVCGLLCALVCGDAMMSLWTRFLLHVSLHAVCLPV